MHSFLESRITDPKSIDTNLVQGIFDSGQIPTIQFSAPTYSVKILEEIDDLCCLYQDKIEIRFFDHYQSEFDARILARIPNVVLLSIDCLRKIKNLEQISNLKKISRLNFGVFEFDQKEVLEILPLNKLKHLTM